MIGFRVIIGFRVEGLGSRVYQKRVTGTEESFGNHSPSKTYPRILM